MNEFYISAISVLAAMACGLSAGATAKGISINEYRVDKDRIAAEQRSAIASCDSFADNAKRICIAEVKGNAAAKAEVDRRYKPRQKTHYQARVAKAEAVNSPALEECDDTNDRVKEVCATEAKVAENGARADAKAQR